MLKIKHCRFFLNQKQREKNKEKCKIRKKKYALFEK
jgi:hypothetical protein